MNKLLDDLAFVLGATLGLTLLGIGATLGLADRAFGWTCERLAISPKDSK